jgi:putative serine protease PepD
MTKRIPIFLSIAALCAAIAAFAAGLSYGGGQAAEAPLTAPAAAVALQTAYERVVKAVSPSVVQIDTNSGLGSGIVFDRAGDIVTNAHVVGTDTKFTVTFSDGHQSPGTLVGKFVPDDLAVIKVAQAGVPPAVFANSAAVKVGQLAMAIGNPLGFRSSVTEGIVSAVGRTVPEPNGVALPQVIQTSAAINPGNSGGALVDINGRVIGIPTLGVTDPQVGTTAAGIGFAIPSNTVTDIAAQLVKNGKVTNSHRAYLGVQVGDTTDASGVLVGTVTAGQPADKAGIKAGDVIVSVAGKPTPTSADLSTVLAGLKPGQTVQVGLRHQDGSKGTVSLTLGEYPGG